MTQQDWVKDYSRGRKLIPSAPGHARPEGVVERTIDCMRGSPWRIHDVGNAFSDLLTLGTGRHREDPLALHSIAVSHWSVEDRGKAALTLYQGPCGAHLIVLHHAVGLDRECTLCGWDVGIAENTERDKMIPESTDVVDAPDDLPWGT